MGDVMHRYYRSDILIKIGKDRGYYTKRALVQRIGKLLRRGERQAAKRLYGYMPFTFLESFIVADFFEMTPAEYCDTFLNGLFKENERGQIVSHVDDANELLERESDDKRIKKNRAKRVKTEREGIVRELDRL